MPRMCQIPPDYFGEWRSAMLPQTRNRQDCQEENSGNSQERTGKITTKKIRTFIYQEK